MAAANHYYAVEDASSGEAYFFNAATKETLWELPPGAVLLAKVVPEGDTAAMGASSVTEGWIFKSDPANRTFKRRWVVVDSAAQVLTYYANNPRTTLAKYQVTEAPKGTFALAGARVQLVEAPPTGAPAPHCLQLFTGRKQPMFACKKVTSRARWMEVLQFAISGAGTGADAAPSVAECVTLTACAAAPWEGWLYKTDPEGRTWTKRYGYLDSANYTLTYFTDNTRAVAKGSIDLRGASVQLGVGPAVTAMMGETAARETAGLHIVTVGAEGRGRTYALRVDSLETLATLASRAIAVIKAAAAGGGAAAAPGGGVVNGNPLHSKGAQAAAVTGARGWLHKSNPKGQYWKRRWAEVVVSPPDPAHGVCVKYLTAAAGEGGTLKGAIPLAGASVELVERSTTPQVKGAPTVFALVIRTPARDWWLAAETGADRNAWYMALGAAIARA